MNMLPMAANIKVIVQGKATSPIHIKKITNENDIKELMMNCGSHLLVSSQRSETLTTSKFLGVILWPGHISFSHKIFSIFVICTHITKSPRVPLTKRQRWPFFVYIFKHSIYAHTIFCTHIWSRLLKRQMSITVYCLPTRKTNFHFPCLFAENKQKCAVSVFHLQQTNRRCCFSVRSVFAYRYIYILKRRHICIDIYLYLYIYILPLP